MWGFGAPNRTDLGAATAVEHHDWGFGDPTPTGWVPADSIDWGFGDVANPPGLVILALASAATVRDDGGELVRLLAAWPNDAGPYRVQLRDSYTAAIYPDPGQAPGCTAPLVLNASGELPADRTDPTLCAPTLRAVSAPGQAPMQPGPYLTFILPPVPPSKYDILVLYGEDFALSVVLAGALSVIYRPRSRQQWRVRAMLPGVYAVGATGPRQEQLAATGQHNDGE